MILIDLNRPHLYPQFDLITHLVYSARSEDVDTVIVDGNIVVDNRMLLTADLKKFVTKWKGERKRLPCKYRRIKFFLSE
ncbi:hypothetical protein MASR1M31_09200 [Porphyromonadaceae bacterium]